MRAAIRQHLSSFGLNETARGGHSNGLLVGDQVGITAGRVVHKIRGNNFMIYGVQYVAIEHNQKKYELNFWPEGVVIYTPDQLNKAAPHCASVFYFSSFSHFYLNSLLVNQSIDTNSPIRKLLGDGEAVPASGSGGPTTLTDLIQAIKSHNRTVHKYSIEE